jgi:prophage regulatory protein
MKIEFQRLPAILAARGRRRSAHYEDIRQGLFTRPVSIGSRSVAWPLHELQALNNARLAGKSADEIRQLVRRLEADRLTAATNYGDAKASRPHPMAPRDDLEDCEGDRRAAK